MRGRPERLRLLSSVALVRDETNGVVMLAHGIDEQRPIASITKLMTAIVVLDASLAFDEPIEITSADRDRLKGSRSRLPIGAVFTRRELLHVALAASDNRAAAALARTHPGGQAAFVRAMNDKARQLGMTKTRFVEATGLDKRNVSTARDLAQLATHLDHYPIVRLLSTTVEFVLLDKHDGRVLEFHNTNPFVRRLDWQVGLSKTGYIAEAGNCLLMTGVVNDRPVTLVLLNSWGKMSPYGDSNRIRDWLLRTEREIDQNDRQLARASL
jgi:D-alanyl-D-alanine endopeptidase (penicillin-binding protein 7)